MTKFYFVMVGDAGSVVESENWPGDTTPAWSSISGGYDTVEALRRGTGLQDKCSLCSQPYTTQYTDDVKSVLLAKNICFTCWFWTEHIKAGGLVIAGRHYTLGREDGGQVRGMGGRLFRIRMLSDGRVVESTNLWHQGAVPAHLLERFPDNAEFLDGAGYVDVGNGHGAFDSSKVRS